MSDTGTTRFSLEGRDTPKGLWSDCPSQRGVMGTWLILSVTMPVSRAVTSCTEGEIQKAVPAMTAPPHSHEGRRSTSASFRWHNVSWIFSVSSAKHGGSMGLQHPSPVCCPACCRVLLLPQRCLTSNMDISVTSSCSAFPALEQEGWWPGPEALYSSSYSSASIYWQGRVKSHISRVRGSPAAGVLPAYEDNKHLMNELPESVSLQ